MLLLVASYMFYSFAGLKYLIYIIATTVTTYLISRRLNLIQMVQVLYLNEHKASMDREERKAYKARMKRKQRRWMILCMVFNFGILAVMKYTDFMITNINGLF
jgi:hypothetical protein